jgi:putative MATE family efflux protein
MLPATVLGGVLNIPLDLLFIVKMHMGVAGAAYATILSQAVTLALLMLVFATKNDLLTLSVRNLSHEWEPYREILRSGMPTLCRQGFACSSNILMNYAARGFGDIAVAAITIVGKLFLIVQWLSLGYFQGVQPILGFNFGAKKYGRVKDTYLFALISASLTLAGVGIFSFLFAPQIVSLFATGDHEVLEIAAQTFRYQCITMPFLPFVLVCNMAFQACGKNKWSSITSSARQGIFFIPAVLLLPEMFGLKGLELVQATADMCAFCLSFYFVGKFVKELNVLIASAGEERDR